MFDFFKKTKGDALTADALRSALVDVEAALPGTREKLRRAEQHRAAMLLTGSDTEVAKAETAIAAARIEAERAQIVRDELERRFGEADQAEFVGKLDARRAAVEARAATFGQTMAARYDKAAAQIVALLEEAAEIEHEIDAVHNAEIEAARAGRIEPRAPIVRVEDRADEWRDKVVESRWTVLTSLRASRSQPGWGAGRTAMAGIVSSE